MGEGRLPEGFTILVDVPGQVQRLSRLQTKFALLPTGVDLHHDTHFQLSMCLHIGFKSVGLESHLNQIKLSRRQATSSSLSGRKTISSAETSFSLCPCMRDVKYMQSPGGESGQRGDTWTMTGRGSLEAVETALFSLLANCKTVASLKSLTKRV